MARVEFFNGAVKVGEDTTAPYSFTWGGVAAGTYTLTARATDDLGASTTSAPATISVSAANTAPSASITSPADGATFAWKPTITITATASDPGGSVTKVEFRDGTTVLGQDTSAPYVHVEERPAREPRPDGPRDRQRGCGHDQQSRRHHREAEALSHAQTNGRASSPA